MGNIPIQNQQIGPGLGTVTNAPMNRTGGVGGKIVQDVASEAEAFLTKIADQDAAVEGLNRLADFKAMQTKRLDELQRSVKTPDGFTPLALKDFDTVSKDYLKNIENKRVVQFLETRMPDVRAGVASSAVGWETNARQALRVQNFTESLNKYQTMASGNLGTYAGARADVLSAIELGGFDPAEAAKLRDTGLKSLARSAVFGEIDRNPQGMLDTLNSGGFADLDADTRLQAINAAQNEIKRKESEAKADKNLARQENLTRVQLWARDDQLSRQYTGKPVPLPADITDETLSTIMKPGEIERLRNSQARADGVYRATADLPTQTLPQMVATVEALNPVGGKEGFEPDLAAYKAAKTKMDEILRQRATNPGAFVRGAFPKVQAAWQAYEKTQNPADLQAAMDASLAAQVSVGIPAAARRPLDENFAKSIAGQIKGENPDKAYEAIQTWRNAFGPKWGAALRQIGKDLPPAYAIAATVEDKTDAAILIQNSRMPIADLRKAAGEDAKKITDEIAASDEVNELGRSFGLAGANLKKQVMDAVEVLALGRATTQGDGDPVGSAIKSVISNKYGFGYFNSKPFAVDGAKYRGRVSEIETGATNALEKLDPANIDVVGIQPGIPEATQRQSVKASIRRNGYWTTTEGGGGLTLVGPKGTPIMSNGKPIRYTFDELLEFSKEKPDTLPWGKSFRGAGGPMDSVATSGGGFKVSLSSYFSTFKEGDIYEDPKAGMFIRRGDNMVPYEPKQEAPVDSEFAMTEGEFLSGNAEDTRPKAPTREEVSRFLVQKGKEAPKFEGDYNKVPKWLKDIELARRQGNYGRSGIAPRAEAQIAAIQAEYDQADAAYRKRLRHTPVIKELVRLGMLK